MKKHLKFSLLPYPNVFFTCRWRFLFIFFFLNLGFSFLTSAQKIEWDRSLGGNAIDQLYSLQQTQDGGYILGGLSASGPNGDKTQPNKGVRDYWIVKLRANGSKEWDKSFGGNQDEILQFVQQTTDGGYILGGHSKSGISGDKTEGAFGNYDFWVIKVDAQGNKQWDKTYGGDKDERLVELQQTQDGGYILGGHSSSGVSGSKTEPSRGGTDYWVVKLQADGTKVWDKTIGSKSSENLQAILQTRDGGYLLGGSSSGVISGDKTEERHDRYSDYWVVKLNAGGQKIWDKTIGGNLSDYLFSLLQLPDGGYLLGGHSSSDKSHEKTEDHKGFSDYWIVKLNPDGSKGWDKTVGGKHIDELASMKLTKDGGILLGGTSRSGIGADKSEPNHGSYDWDFWVAKVSANGQKVLWDKTIGSEGDDYLTDLQQTQDSGYVLGGRSPSRKTGDKSEEGKGSTDYWVVKLDNSIKLKNQITFEPILNKEVGDPAFPLVAKATSGLPVTFEVLSGPAIIKNNKLTIKGAGWVRLVATQEGNTEYERVVDTTQSFLVTLTGKQWQKNYGGNKTDMLSTMLPTPDGGYIIGGTSNSDASADKSQNSKGNTDFWVAKINASGQKVWDKTYGGNQADQLTALVATPDGNYLLGGTSASNSSGDKSQASNGLEDYWLVKIGANGTKLWDKTFGGSQSDWLATMVTSLDGGYLLGGTSASDKSGDKSQPSWDTNQEPSSRRDYWLLKLDANGNKIWDKTYGGDKFDKLTAITLNPKGGYLVGGYSSSGISGDKTQPPRGLADYWVLRIDEQGKKVWDNTYGGVISYYNGKGYYEAGASLLSSIVPTPDGGFLLGGSSSATTGGEKTSQTAGMHDEIYDYWVVKINNSGKKVWDKSYGGLVVYPGQIGVGEFWTYTGTSNLSTIIPLPEGGYLLAGTSNGDTGRNKSEDNRSNISKIEDERQKEGFTEVKTSVWNDYWLVKIDEQGQFIVDRTIGGQRNDMLASAIRTSGGNILLGGTTYSDIGADKNTGNVGDADFWVVQVQPDKTPEPLAAAWDNLFGSYRNEGLTDVIKTADGGYLTAGFSDSYPGGDKTQNNLGKYDYWIVKTDRNGKKLWDKTYGGSDDDFLNRVIQTADGGYLLAGSSLSGKAGDKSEASLGKRDFWLIKVDATGTKQWDKTFGGSGDDELKKVIQLSTGEYIVAGHSNSPISADKTQSSQGGTDYWLMKISSTGSKIWDKRYGGNKEEALGSFTQTPEGGFLLVGTSLSNTSGDKSEPSQGSSDYWAVKTDQNGNLLWEKTFGGSATDEANSIVRNGNEYYISGTSSSNSSGEKSGNNQGGKDYWLIKIDTNGTKLWDRTFGGSQDDELRASTRLANGHIVLGGTSFSEVSGTKTQTSRGNSDFWIVEVDAEGNPMYDKRFGGSGTEELRTIFQTSDGGLLLGGRSDSNVSGEHSQTSWGRSDYWLVKVAPESITSSAAVVARQAFAPEVTPQISLLNAFPNPVREKVTVQFSLPQTQAVSVKIYDSQGQEVKTLFQGEAQANQTYQLEWQAGNKPAGLYFLQLQTPTKQQQQKLLLTK
ncbi:T9SS type A sorting domain-containing protein [Adhaeribacter radiodurans]|uniref:T9SS type A sorting domain-containing protein n=1 Tax=Adhaeribacter radiodurans TaxID=2745197 RepID=A0A7L7LAE7_9BACT|nr:T9SS type A sorting domain-containing protein [Adhaeribacter radiodurans]QMU29525.1 T9SS type A sorting domain-containing protein [Adhaeribacter radiodurans]